MEWPAELASTHLSSLAGTAINQPPDATAAFPNDGFYGSYSRQWHVDRIWAPQAWDVTTGSKQARGGRLWVARPACSSGAAPELAPAAALLRVLCSPPPRWASASSTAVPGSRTRTWLTTSWAGGTGGRAGSAGGASAVGAPCGLSAVAAGQGGMQPRRSHVRWTQAPAQPVPAAPGWRSRRRGWPRAARRRCPPTLHTPT